ncbi:MAG: enoyl-CoA hydratase [Actinobacteria bacterium]|nr:enoyl-CoA hydratase [Actinomycetota bacterium]
MTAVRCDDRGPLTVVTIDRPDRRNAVDLKTLLALEAAIDAARADADRRVLVLTGSQGHFCAGADLSGVEDTTFVDTLGRVLNGLRTARFPTMAAIEGAALGAGTQLAVACDLRVAASDATFGIPAAKLGLMVDQWTIRRMVDVLGQGPARSMLLAADTISGERAFELGLVQRLGGLDLALEWAHIIATLAPLTIEGHKIGLNETEEIPPTTPQYQAAFARAWTSNDLQEGLASFRERRPAKFCGD